MNKTHAFFVIALLQCFIVGCFCKCDGKCVPINMCKTNDAMFHVDLRTGAEEEESECDHYLEVCCADNDLIPVTDPSRDSGENNEFSSCGDRNNHGIGFRISNAHNNETEFGEFPWMVALMVLEAKSSEGRYICGGSLVKSNIVMTAAHCVVNVSANSLVARAGEWDTRTENEIRPYQDRRVKKIIFHENYSKKFHYNDIALLVVETPFIPDDNVQLICLMPQGMSLSNRDCMATGWGKENFNSPNYHVILKKVELPLVDSKSCEKALRTTRLGNQFRLHNSFHCAGGEAGLDTCTGDGGSPLVCQISSTIPTYYQAGIVAWGIGCGESGIPGVYVKTSLYTNWIREIMDRN